MKSKILILFSITLLALSTQGAFAGDIVVITNSGVTISTVEIKDVFLGEKQFAGSTKLVVIDNKSVQEKFLSKFLGFDIAKYNSIWTKKSFRDGLNPPSTKQNDSEVIEFVKQTPGAVGYVSTSPEGVNIVR